MSKIKIILAFMSFISALACSAQTDKKDLQTGSADKVEMYYFHFSARCVTCKTVEAQAKQNIETLYPEQLKQGKISFRTVNLDDESSKALAEKLKVYGQTLLVVKGDKQVILTNEGFMYAVGDPEKFKAVMKEKIDPLL
jgi:hypothetical protein